MISIRVNSDATFDVLADGRALVTGATAEVVYRDARGQERLLRAATSTGNVLLGADDDLEMTWRSEGDSAQVEIQHHGGSPINLERIDVLACHATRGGKVHLGRAYDLVLLEHGWQSWSPVRLRPAGAADERFTEDDYDEKHVPHGRRSLREAKSEWFTLLNCSGSKDAALLGFVTAANQLSEVCLETEGEEVAYLNAMCYADGAQLDPGATFRSERLWFAWGEPRALMDDYVGRLGAGMNPRLPARGLSGWCTWYQFFGENDETDVATNLARIREERLPLELILIDDGYQTAIGDWTTIRPEKFPHGMRAAAETIRQAGGTPGIWLAPFGARQDSRLATEHPEFLLRNPTGEPVLAWHHWGEPIYALDLTHPALLDHLRQLFRTVAVEWGYDVFKLDFLFAGAASGRHHDPYATRAQAYRRGLQAIREAIGEERWIIGCGAPQATSIGLVEAMRVGQDVAIFWNPLENDPSGPSVSNAMENSILRSSFDRRLWLNDPDCVILRTRRDANLLTANEVRTLTTVVALTGEMILDGDELGVVPPPRLNDLRRILPPLDHTAEVRDLFAEVSEPPRQLLLRLSRPWGEWLVLAVINWSARSRESVVELPGNKAYHVYDFWRKKYLGIQSRVRLAQGPHATAVLNLAPADRDPGLIASTFHISGGYAEVKALDRAAGGLRLEVEKSGRQRGELVFAIPKRTRAGRAQVNGHHAGTKRRAPGVVSVGFALDERAVVELEWGDSTRRPPAH